ncbi:MAG: DUF3467 domain-containing protein [Planctomycetota bacterium]
MSPSFHPDDRPEPTEQPIRARVPDHVAAGAFSTGVIVMTANSEFILDFVQNLGRPHQIVARVVMPHYVLPQLVDALQRNIDLYRSRWGDLPNSALPAPTQLPWSQNQQGAAASPPNPSIPAEPTPPPATNAGSPGAGPASGGPTGGGGPASGSGPVGGTGDFGTTETPAQPGTPPGQPPADSNPPQNSGRQATAQDIYDDLKIKDELLSGAYANAVMIGHGPHEFSFDFITNFYPHSSVSTRVFLAAGQIPRLFDSLRGTWEQLRARQSGGNNPLNPGSPPPPEGPNDS